MAHQDDDEPHSAPDQVLPSAQSLEILFLTSNHKLSKRATLKAIHFSCNLVALFTQLTRLEMSPDNLKNQRKYFYEIIISKF